MKRLILARHAKSSWSYPHLSDIERPLNKRGKKAAPIMGRALRDRNLIPEAIFASPSVRTRKTSALLAEQLIDGELSVADRKALEEGESLDEIKAKLKPKKSAISADMLDTANSYDDKVAVVRLLVAEDAGRVANVLKKMIKPV